MTDEPEKKRQKSTESNESETIGAVHLSINDHEEEEENHLDKQIEHEENKADNLVIKDLMGSMKPESNKVIQSKISLIYFEFFVLEND